MTDDTRTAPMGSDQSGNSPAALVVPGSRAVSEPIVLSNDLWAPANPAAYNGGLPAEVTHLAEFGATDAGRLHLRSMLMD